jgi:hypothetical protein
MTSPKYWSAAISAATSRGNLPVTSISAAIGASFSSENLLAVRLITACFMEGSKRMAASYSKWAPVSNRKSLGKGLDRITGSTGLGKKGQAGRRMGKVWFSLRLRYSPQSDKIKARD